MRAESPVLHTVTGNYDTAAFPFSSHQCTYLLFYSGSVEMNDQSSICSTRDASRGVSVENDNRTASISSDEGVQPLPPDKSPVIQQKASSFKNRLFPKTPNTLSVQPYGSLGQSLPNLTLGSPNLSPSPQNTLSVPGKNGGGHLLSPTHRGISYPPPSPTRGNLRRSLAISQNKNPPLIKTRQVNSASSASQLAPVSLDFDVPVIAGDYSFFFFFLYSIFVWVVFVCYIDFFNRIHMKSIKSNFDTTQSKIH